MRHMLKNQKETCAFIRKHFQERKKFARRGERVCLKNSFVTTAYFLYCRGLWKKEAVKGISSSSKKGKKGNDIRVGGTRKKTLRKKCNHQHST